MNQSHNFKLFCIQVVLQNSDIHAIFLLPSQHWLGKAVFQKLQCKIFMKSPLSQLSLQVSLQINMKLPWHVWQKKRKLLKQVINTASHASYLSPLERLSIAEWWEARNVLILYFCNPIECNIMKCSTLLILFFLDF